MPSVYVSPSSQEHNLYATGGTEEQWMNKIADELIPLLNFNGIKTYRNSITMDLKAIIKDSNNKNPDVHFAIHSNAGGSRGCEVFAWKEPNKITNSERLGQLVYNEVSQITPVADRGIKDGKVARLGEIIKVNATSCLIEVDFHDNREGSEWIKNNITLIAKAIAKGICKYFGMTYKEPKQQNTEIMVYGTKEEKFGLYLKEEYALNRCKILKNEGYTNIYYIDQNRNKKVYN